MSFPICSHILETSVHEQVELFYRHLPLMLLCRSYGIEVNLAYFLVLRKFLSGSLFWQENSLLFQKVSRKVSENSKLKGLHEEFVFGDVAKEVVQQLLSFEYKFFVHVALECLKRTLNLQ